MYRINEFYVLIKTVQKTYHKVERTWVTWHQSGKKYTDDCPWKKVLIISLPVCTFLAFVSLISSCTGTRVGIDKIETFSAVQTRLTIALVYICKYSKYHNWLKKRKNLHERSLRKSLGLQLPYSVVASKIMPSSKPEMQWKQVTNYKYIKTFLFSWK